MLSGLLDVLFDLSCIGCGTPGTRWCAHCLDRSWSPSTSTGVQGRAIVAAAPYGAVVQRAVVAHKERGQLALARPLGVLLARAVSVLDVEEPLLLIPCPSSRSAIRCRGQDHAKRLAVGAARFLRAGPQPVGVCTPLVLAKEHSDQVGLSMRQRRENLRNTLVARAPGGLVAPVVVVDDVTTSGSTLTEAIRALMIAGWPVVGAAVVARAGTPVGVAGATDVD